MRSYVSLLTIYLILLHIVFIFLLYLHFSEDNQSKPNSFYQELSGHYLRKDRNVSADAVLFIGSSSIQGLDVGSVSDRAVNFGIGGESIKQTYTRIAQYHSVKTAATVVVAIGFNDLFTRENQAILTDMNRIMSVIPPATKLVLVGIQPALGTSKPAQAIQDINHRITSLNHAYQDLCGRRQGCLYLDLKAVFDQDKECQGRPVHEPDGIHLNAAGYQCWKAALREALSVSKDNI